MTTPEAVLPGRKERRQPLRSGGDVRGPWRGHRGPPGQHRPHSGPRAAMSLSLHTEPIASVRGLICRWLQAPLCLDCCSDPGGWRETPLCTSSSRALPTPASLLQGSQVSSLGWGTPGCAVPQPTTGSGPFSGPLLPQVSQGQR